MMQIYTGDNLDTLKRLRDNGELFDLVELDGPYMAGLEDWDNLTEDEYVQHYADRLSIVREILQPWGVVFVFGYPEGCAEIKSWTRRTGTLYLRRWLTWYKQMTAHKGRKIENILIFEHYRFDIWEIFKKELREKRLAKNMTVKDCMIETDINVDKVITGERGGGGFLWFEASSSRYPTPDEYKKISNLFSISDECARVQALSGYDNLTNIDFISKTYIEDTEELNDNGLRSKPIGLYLDLFKPTMPNNDNKRALILYGGSGNAGIAAGALGYDVTICEFDHSRAEAIRQRYDRMVAKWREKITAQQLTFTDVMQAQPSLFQEG